MKKYIISAILAISLFTFSASQIRAISAPPLVPQEKLTCNSDKGINTAIGCIPIHDETALMTFLLRWGIGIAGGTCLILIVYAGFLLITSSGNPDKVQAGKELMTAAVSGVVFLVLSTLVLRIIGYDILKLPRFG